MSINFDLDYRKKRFEALFANKKTKNYAGLINFSKIDTKIFKNLQKHCLNFIIASFEDKIKKQKVFRSENEKLEFILTNIKDLYSITPNGFVVPKSHSNNEYNILLKSFYNLFDTGELKDKIKYWQDPIGICIKTVDNSSLDTKKSGRLYHQTKNSHIESWAGYSNFGINTLLPLFGDTQNNYTEFFSPKENYNDHAVNSVTRKNIDEVKSKNYNSTPINSKFQNNYKCGTIICWDNSLLHRAKINDTKSYRIFIVNQFIPYLTRNESKGHKISKHRKLALLTHNILSSKKHLLRFHSINDRRFKSSLGGRRDSYNYSVIRLK